MLNKHKLQSLKTVLPIIFLCPSISIGAFSNTGLKINKNIAPVGIFKHKDPQLKNLSFANWGSRPFEYQWASTIVQVKGKRVIDLGIGLPSQHSWYKYVINNLKPAFYLGIDIDEQIVKEEVSTESYAIKQMSMTNITYPSQYFDIAYCLSTFEHLTYQHFVKAIDEIYRVLKNNGILVVTLDERWNKDLPQTYDNSWNVLEQSLINANLFKRTIIPFGLPDFLKIIQHKFVCYTNVIINDQNKTIALPNGTILYQRTNCDETILHSPSTYDCTTSYIVLKKVN